MMQWSEEVFQTQTNGEHVDDVKMIQSATIALVVSQIFLNLEILSKRREKDFIKYLLIVIKCYLTFRFQENTISETNIMD